MKKFILGVVIVCVILTGFTIHNIVFDEIHIVGSAKLPYYGDAEAVADVSELIVSARKLDEKPVAYDMGEGRYDNFTLSRVEIIAVYKQTEDLHYKSGDMISILESEWYNPSDRVVHHTENYTKMKDSKAYILYLGHNPDVDNFYPVGLLYGKLPEDGNEPIFYGDANKYAHISEVINELQKLKY
jgi:hypothetical protein